MPHLHETLDGGARERERESVRDSSQLKLVALCLQYDLYIRHERST